MMGAKTAVYKIFKGKEEPITGTSDVVADVLGVTPKTVTKYAMEQRVNRVSLLGGRSKCNLPFGYKIGEYNGGEYIPSEFFVLLNGKEIYKGTIDAVAELAKTSVENIERLLFEPIFIQRRNGVYILELKPRWRV